MSLNAFALNGSLKSSSEASSTDKLIGEALTALERIDAFLGEADPDGRMVSLDRVAAHLARLLADQPYPG